MQGSAQEKKNVLQPGKRSRFQKTSSPKTSDTVQGSYKHNSSHLWERGSAKKEHGLYKQIQNGTMHQSIYLRQAFKMLSVMLSLKMTGIASGLAQETSLFRFDTGHIDVCSTPRFAMSTPMIQTTTSCLRITSGRPSCAQSAQTAQHRPQPPEIGDRPAEGGLGEGLAYHRPTRTGGNNGRRAGYRTRGLCADGSSRGRTRDQAQGRAQGLVWKRRSTTARREAARRRLRGTPQGPTLRKAVKVAAKDLNRRRIAAVTSLFDEHAARLERMRRNEDHAGFYEHVKGLGEAPGVPEHQGRGG